MSKQRIPHDAFEFYFALGPGRSYQAVAERYGVTKRAVTKHAAREDWQPRLEKVESEARAKADQKKVEALDAAKERHMQALRLVLGKGVEALRSMQIDTAGDAVRAITSAIRELRVELGEPSDRTAITVEDVIKREYARWMVPVADEHEQPGQPGVEV